MKHPIASVAGLVLLQLPLGCAASSTTTAESTVPAATEPSRVAPTPSAQQPLGPGKRHPQLQRATQAVIDTAKVPTAAAVLSVGQVELLALGEPNGQHLATTPLRPGSTLKPLVALVALEHGLLSPGESIACEREHSRIPGFSCFDRHGRLSLTRALTVSCNVYFFTLAERVGLDRLSAGFAKLGLAGPTGLAAGESPGLLPDRSWLDRNATDMPSDWPGWPALIGTGHGPIKVTLLQLAVAYTRLLDRLRQLHASAAPDQAAVAIEIESGLHGAVNDAAGTAHEARGDGVSISGKTGTAEGCSVHQADCAEPENGWFVGFAPSEEPQVLVAVLARGGKSGGQSAAPVAAQVFDAWLRLGRPVSPEP